MILTALFSPINLSDLCPAKIGQKTPEGKHIKKALPHPPKKEAPFFNL